jgi:hypothetical protein
MPEKYQMASPQWLAALHAFMVAARPSLPLTGDVTLCEVYRNVPNTIPAHDGTVAFTVRYRKDSMDVDFETREADDATVKLTFAYEDVVPLGRFVVGGDAQRAAEMFGMLRDLIRNGRATLEGEMPAEMQASPVHDQVARLTA